MRAIEDLAQSLADGQTTSRALVEEALARIADPGGRGRAHVHQGACRAGARGGGRGRRGAAGWTARLAVTRAFRSR